MYTTSQKRSICNLFAQINKKNGQELQVPTRFKSFNLTYMYKKSILRIQWLYQLGYAVVYYSDWCLSFWACIAISSKRLRASVIFVKLPL